MRALILNGGAAGDADLAVAQAALERALEGAGWETGAVVLHGVDLAYCTGCFECWTKTPGECKTKDAAPDISRALIASDLAVFLTPITFGGYSSQLKKALDRMICLVSPFFGRVEGETHHLKRYDDYPSLFGVGVLPDSDPAEERIFATLVERNAINMHSPTHASAVLYRGMDEAATRRALEPFVGRFVLAEVS